LPASFQVCDLAKEHERSGFDSKCPPLDDFLQKYARQAATKFESVTKVAAVDSQILGYVTWVACELDLRGAKRPGLKLGRMAVDHRHRGLGIGDRLVAETLQAAKLMRATVGCCGVVVDAKRCSQADRFYQRLGFAVLMDDPSNPTIEMFMSTKNL
jgi:predicted N-acetyltransferase YhbS